MAAMAGILNHQMTAGQVLTGAGAAPTASAAAPTSGTGSTTSSSNSNSSGSADASSATISANDFLTLLVTEMQNQDPTADTDPNEYINQLVQVNSLEQLIDINQNLSTALGSSAAGSGGAATPQASGATPTAGLAGAGTAVARAQAGAVANKANALTTAQPAAAGSSQTAASAVDKLAPGNLGVPDATPAALRVAQALNGKSRNHSIPGIQSGANGLPRTP
jgi:flagellar basal-body rod modification protein FlgD